MNPKGATLAVLALTAILMLVGSWPAGPASHRLGVQATPDSLVFSTFLGGRCGSDRPERIAVDDEGSVYVTGTTCARDFPTTPGAFNRTFPDSAMYRMFVAKMSESHTLVYSTFVGGSLGFWSDDPVGLIVDTAGHAYVAGVTNSSDFPATPGAYQETYGGNDDAFVLELSADGSSLLYATFLGGQTADGATGLAVDASGNAFVTGWTTDHWIAQPSLGTDNFPTTPGAFDGTYAGGQDGWVAKLSPDGSRLIYSTLLGGTGDDTPYALRFDGQGDAFVAGQTSSLDFPVTPGAFSRQVTPPRSAADPFGGTDAFVTELSPDGGHLAYSTLFGGNGWDSPEELVLDSRGHAYIAGFTTSTDLPVTPGAVQPRIVSYQDGFLAEFSTTGTDLLYSTYLGGGGEFVTGLAWANATTLVLAGITGSDAFPTTPGAYDVQRSGTEDGFVATINVENGTLVYATLLGGSGADEIDGMALNPAGHAVLFGFTTSTDFPLTGDRLPYPANGWGDMFVTELALIATQAVSTPPAALLFDLAIVAVGLGVASLAALFALWFRRKRRPPAP